jgi:hypothetical protein
MGVEHRAGLAGVLLLGGLVGLRTHGAPAPAPAPAPQAGRFVQSKTTILQAREDGEQFGYEVETLLDNGTARLWVLEDLGSV